MTEVYFLWKERVFSNVEMDGHMWREIENIKINLKTVLNII